MKVYFISGNMEEIGCGKNLSFAFLNAMKRCAKKKGTVMLGKVVAANEKGFESIKTHKKGTNYCPTQILLSMLGIDFFKTPRSK